MIRALILFYLNNKSTHGYEIQRFIQLAGIDSWAKIQSGSIYYALSKLEKEKNIEIISEESEGQRIRKIYGITEKGKETLHKEMLEELSHPIQNIGSVKFITEPILYTLDTKEIQEVVNQHIKELKNQMEYWKEWKETKLSSNPNHLMELSFNMSIRSLQDQISWHEELLNHLDQYREESKSMITFLKSFDADRIDGITKFKDSVNSIEFAKRLKETIQLNPELAIQDLDRLIQELNQK